MSIKLWARKKVTAEWLFTDIFCIRIKECHLKLRGDSCRANKARWFFGKVLLCSGVSCHVDSVSFHVLKGKLVRMGSKNELEVAECIWIPSGCVRGAIFWRPGDCLREEGTFLSLLAFSWMSEHGCFSDMAYWCMWICDLSRLSPSNIIAVKFLDLPWDFSFRKDNLF